MKINYNLLKLIDYEGAGNRTPVLDISHIENISGLDPIEVRKTLENDRDFREWLIKEGTAHHADSVMIFYKASNPDYEFVTFIGEPNSPMENGFSEMCGNGIRSLALHIVLTEENEDRLQSYLKKGISIWAGSIRRIFIDEVNTDNNSAMVRVNLGEIQTSREHLDGYINRQHFNSEDLSETTSLEILPEYLKNRKIGIGLNGARAGEPHLVLVNNIEEYLELVRLFGLPEEINERQILENLRLMTSSVGREVTFNHHYFPGGINFNLAVVWNDKIYISTHERNMSESSFKCKSAILRSGYCHCNTLACGTGGSIACVIAERQGYINSDDFITIHPGGDIEYRIENNESIMIGSAQKKENIRNNFRKVFPDASALPKNLFLE